ncbi:MAG: hypothetical protein RLO81_16035 [Fulvivirga sp.]|uniref:hypothetical protein n=1 Tax=Fulvivirga sp. TaxID=1931237 RepID=UPI0032ED4C5C
MGIEKFFITSFLKVALLGVGIVLILDAIIYPEDTLSLIIDAAILITSIICYWLSRNYINAATIVFGTVVLGLMLLQSLTVPVNTTISLSIILVIGFVFSILLKKAVLVTMHAITILLCTTIFILQASNAELRFQQEPVEVLTLAVTFFILYGVLTSSTFFLKSKYDSNRNYLKELNSNLHDKAMEIEAQNEELIQIQDNLNELNIELEKKVEERTRLLKTKNKRLLMYSHNIAHDIRGPVARLLGLANISKLDKDSNPHLFIDKIQDQTIELDKVVRKISLGLEQDDQIDEGKAS